MPIETPTARPWLVLAKELDWPLTGSLRAFVRRAQSRLARRRPDTVVLFADEESSRLGELLQQAWPGSSVTVFRPNAEDSAVHAELTAIGPVDVIIDADLVDPAARTARFRRTFLHLAEGGCYLLRRVDAKLKPDTRAETVWQYVARLIDRRDRGGYPDEPDLRKRKTDPVGAEEKAIAEAIRRVGYDEELIMITSSGPRLFPKLREWEVERVLAGKPGIGRILIKKDGLTTPTRGGLRTNHDRLNHRFSSEYEVPQLQLREYDDVICGPHQVVLSHDILLPDTFRHVTQPKLTSRFLDDAGPLFARYPRDLTEPKRLDGSYFYLSSEWPRHFGHVMTEQLSRMWAWSIAKERHPELKALLPLPGGHNQLADFERAVLSAAGVPIEDFVSPKGVLRVERLLSATPMLVNPTYVHPELAEVWHRAGQHLFAQAERKDWPARVFVSRRPHYKRPCHNLAEVEDFFVRHGFTVLYPEDYSVADQAMIFEQAELVAGFAGSAMFSLLFCSGTKPVILITSESYTARNEYLIASTLGHRLAVVWCDPDIAQPEKGWDGKAFASGFRVDFARDGEFLTELVNTKW